MGKKDSRHFTRDFKRNAVQMVIEKGMPVGRVAQELDIHPALLHQWKRNHIMHNFEDSEVLLEFPKDEGAHEGVKHEWWYFNGHVFDKEGHAYGLMVCFFNNGKLYLGFADEDHNEFYSEIILGHLKAAGNKLDVSVGNNWWVEKDKFTYEMHIEHAETRLDLHMVAERPPLLVGGKGSVHLGNGGTSYYYSQTRLRIDGRLTLLDEEREISGIGWIDRQWGNWDFNGFAGWEWFSVHLDNGSDIQLANLFDPQTGASITPMLNIMHANGTQETLDSYKIEYLDYWTHPETGDKFSHRWRVKIPEKDIELVVIPTVDHQIIHRGLWEGSCKVFGTVGDNAVKGQAYVELLLKSKEMRLLSIAQQLISLSRVHEWWEKLSTVLVVTLVLLVLNPCPANCLWLLPVLAVYMAFLGSYAYALNSYSDREQDRKVGKRSELDFISNRQLLLASCFWAFGAITIPLLFSNFRINILGLITFLLATFYSVKPLRFKERGILGIIVPALVQRPLPFLFFVLLVAPNSVLSWYLLGWLVMVGLTMMFAHQLQDFKYDRKAQVATWAQRAGFYQTKRTTSYFLLLTIAYLTLSFLLFGIKDGLLITVVFFVASVNIIAYTLRSIRQLA
jgi:predicted secreted hydrolase/4-hydroxybenzoate polyprenyltransferase